MSRPADSSLCPRPLCVPPCVTVAGKPNQHPAKGSDCVIACGDTAQTRRGKKVGGGGVQTSRHLKDVTRQMGCLQFYSCSPCSHAEVMTSPVTAPEHACFVSLIKFRQLLHQRGVQGSDLGWQTGCKLLPGGPASQQCHHNPSIYVYLSQETCRGDITPERTFDQC